MQLLLIKGYHPKAQVLLLKPVFSLPLHGHKLFNRGYIQGSKQLVNHGQ